MKEVRHQTREFAMGEQGRFCLAHGDPSPIEVVGEEFCNEFFLTCEHAGRLVPQCLGDLGLDRLEMDRHIAYDIGAEAVARKLSSSLRAPLYIQPYSRLVVDCNRPLEAKDCIPEVSDSTDIPGNCAIALDDRKRRYETIHEPYHRAVSRALDEFTARGREPILLAIHSFTPIMRRTGEVRECELGLLFNRDDRFAKAMLLEVNAAFPNVKACLNEPYHVDDLGDYTIPVHGERRGIPHVLIEIRNDRILDEAGQARWADIIARTARAAAEKMELTTDEL